MRSARPSPWPAARPGIAVCRIAAGAATLAVLLATYVSGIDTDGANPFNYFGYFTNITGTLTSIILITSGAYALSGAPQPTWLTAGRAVAVSCSVIVAVIYNTLIPGTGSAPARVSALLHGIFPTLVLLDWALVGDRAPLPWRRLWIVLPPPLLWLAVVLLRGVTDGWVPYGFLLPSHGVPSLLGHIGGLLAALLAAASLVWVLSRSSGLRSSVSTPARPRNTRANQTVFVAEDLLK